MTVNVQSSAANAAPRPLAAAPKRRTLQPSKPLRADLPGSLDHASGDVDEFDAALVRGAGGLPAASDALAEAGLEADGPTTRHRGRSAGARGLRPRPWAGSGSAAAVAARRAPERSSGAPLRGGNRAIGFLRASWAELQRVQWPDRRQVTQATAVVLGFVAIAGAYLGLADFVAKEIVEAIL